MNPPALPVISDTSLVPTHPVASKADFLQDVLHGLRQTPRSLPCKYFYDERGARLFEEICDLEEYYLTRCELAILQRHAADMTRHLGSDCALIEYGSGSGRKTRLLLDQLTRPAAYVPIDICAEALFQSAQALAHHYPHLSVVPVCADFTTSFPLPALSLATRRTVYFSGSTIGNFAPAEAARLLADIAQRVGPGGGLLIGVDLVKDHAVLEAAYADRRGVTAAFNLNLLQRINRELGADFQLDHFRHHAFFNPTPSRVEMHLVSGRRQTIHLGGQTILLEKGESICTEYSHKYTLESFAALAATAGLHRRDVWTDDRGWYSVQYLRV